MNERDFDTSTVAVMRMVQTLEVTRYAHVAKMLHLLANERDRLQVQLENLRHELEHPRDE